MATADIVQVVSEFVTLRKSGSNFKGLCPFHDEKTPSFMVSPSKQICKCFSCGKGGDVVRFLMEHEQLSYPEALKWLARKYGIDFEERELTGEEREVASQREAMLVVNAWARDYFVKQLHDTAEGVAIGLAYFRTRGLRDDIVRRFQLGYAAERRDALSNEALKLGYDKKYLTATGLALETQDGRLYDRYAGRVIFPVFTISGRVVAFGGRTLLSKEEQKRKGVGKYVNSPESDIYHKKSELYGLYQAKQAIAKQDRVYLVEGYLDVISMFQAGMENVVASSGTSLTSEQVRLIHRFTNNVTVLYDGDAAGRHAALRGVDMLLAEGLNIKVLMLPEGEDPDTFARQHTPQQLRTYIAENETDFITFKTDLLLADAEADPVRRAEAVKDIVASIAVIPDDIVRQEYVHDLARRMNVDETTLVNEVVIFRKRVRDGIREQQERERQRQEADGGSAGGETPAGAPLKTDAGTAMQGAAAAQATAEEVRRLGGTSKAERRLVECERRMVEMAIRYGGLPLLLKEEEVERKFGGGPARGQMEDILSRLEGGATADAAEDAAEAEENPDEAARPMPLTAEEESPRVAAYILEELQAEGLQLSQPVYTAILQEAAEQTADYMAAHPSVTEHFDALSYFRCHPNPEINRWADALAEDPYVLSTGQAARYVPEERRLRYTVPRAVNDYKYALLMVEKEQLLRQLANPAIMAQPDVFAQVSARLMELHAIEREFAKALGDRILYH